MGVEDDTIQPPPPNLRWSTKAVKLRDLLGKRKLPQVAKINSHEHGSFGKGANLDLEQPFLLYSAYRCTKVLAASVYWNDNKQGYRQVVNRLVIPVTYPGWFQLLGTQGKVAKQWTSIQDVADARPRAFISRDALVCYSVTTDPENSEKIYEKKVVRPGEVIIPVGVFFDKEKGVTRTSRLRRLFTSMAGKKDTKKSCHYLQCVDSFDRELALPYDTLGEFSQVGERGTSDPACAYRLHDLVNNINCPSQYKLVCGTLPMAKCQFTGMLQMQEVYLEECIVACTVEGRNRTLLEFPTQSEIGFLRANNHPAVLNELAVLSALSHCQKEVAGYIASIKVVQKFDPDTNSVVPAGAADLPERKIKLDNRETFACDKSEISGGFASNDLDDDRSWQNPNESIYETIPHDFDMQSQMNSEKDHEEHVVPDVLDRTEDDGGYMIPLRVPRYPDKPLPRSNETVTLRHHPRLSLHQDVENSHNKPTLYHRAKSVDGNLKGYVSRLDSFLFDSLREYERRKAQPEESTTSEEAEPALETKEHFDTFLEKIFDVNSAAPKQPSPNHMRRANSTTEIIQKQNKFSRRSMSVMSKIPRLQRVTPASKRASLQTSLSVESHGGCDGSESSSGALEVQSINKHASLHRSLHNLEIPVSDMRAASPSESLIYRLMRTRSCKSIPGEQRDSGVILSSRVFSDDPLNDSDSTYQIMKGGSELDWFPPDEVLSLSVEEVALSLRHIGFKNEHVERFLEEQIDGKQLADLTDELLKDGFPELNGLNRKKILDFISGWRPKKLI